VLIFIDIDEAVSQDARDRANALVQRELRNVNVKEPHHNLPATSDVSFSDLITAELSRIASGQEREGGIDRSRYEEPDEPSTDDDAATWRKSLRSAYISSAYLEGRHVNLALLEELGKNAWLVGNSQLDSILKDLDKELAQLKEEVDSVNRDRKLAQEGSRGEILALEDTWKKGIGRVIEVQLATDQLRQDMRQQYRTTNP
jgi:pre-mRNA-splicing factor SPF27